MVSKKLDTMNKKRREKNEREKLVSFAHWNPAPFIFWGYVHCVLLFFPSRPLWKTRISSPLLLKKEKKK